MCEGITFTSLMFMIRNTKIRECCNPRGLHSTEKFVTLSPLYKYIDEDDFIRLF